LPPPGAAASNSSGLATDDSQIWLGPPGFPAAEEFSEFHSASIFIASEDSKLRA
jgi:hypothetical protein